MNLENQCFLTTACAQLTTFSVLPMSFRVWASREACVTFSGTATIPGPVELPRISKIGLVSTATRPLLEDGVDVFVRFNEGLSILKKVMAVEAEDLNSMTFPENRRFDRLVSSRKPFGFDTTFKGRRLKGIDDVKIYQNGGTGYVARRQILSGARFIDKWKIFTGRAAPGTGNRDTYPHRIIGTPFIGEPGAISSETYLCIGPFDSRCEAESVLSYLSCRLARLLILLHKPSQDTTRKVYTFVPTQDWNRKWSDQDLYDKYGLSDSEIDFVEKIVRPLNVSEDTENG